MVKPQWFFVLGIVLALLCEYTQARTRDDKMMKSAVFHSPEFIMEHGSVVNKFYSNIDFPRGHIGIKRFNAEVVDDAGKPVPLHDTYLHHWVVVRYYKRVGAPDNELQKSDFMSVRNSGVCNNLGQYFGLGSETRKTATHVPDPYAIEVGNPADIPTGYEERWMLNVHAIDTRGVVDGLGCTECRCSLYNVTVDEYGRPLRPDYEGGLLCCYDKTQCKVKEGLASTPRRLYLKYTVKWFDWNYSLLPVNIFIFDITDVVSVSKDSSKSHQCKVEYEVGPCRPSSLSTNGCINTKRLSFKMPRGGYVIYGVAHQHSGGIGSAVYRKDGRVICSSKPNYGKGKEAGDEEGYIVGMSTCYPQPGSIVIDDGETLVLESNYSSSQKHTGVMGLFYILVANQLPRKKNYLDSLLSNVEGTHMPVAPGTVMILLVVVVVVVAISTARLRRCNHPEHGYSPISM